MTLIVGFIIMVFVLNALGQTDEQKKPPSGTDKAPSAKYAVARIPDTYKDIFKPGSAGKPTFGTMSSTCWARGGICVMIRECPSLRIDISIAGCTLGNKVCCVVQKPLSPSVGAARRENLITISNLEDLGTALQIMAYRNSLLLSLNGDLDQDERTHDTSEDSEST